VSARLASLLELGELAPDADVRIEAADPILPTTFDIGDAAAASLGAVGAAAAELHVLRGGAPQSLRVDTHAAAASLIGFALQTVEGAPTPRPAGSYATVALYPARDDRWIHLHGGFPGLRDGTLRVLGCDDSAESIARAVAERDAWELEDALAEARMCGAVARSAAEWTLHPQGIWLERQPAVEIVRIGDAPPERPASRGRPLEGMRVLDLTRVLAGPTCARTLAALGADTLKISGPELPFVPPFVIDTGHGKRSAHLDLRDGGGRDRLAALVRDADVFSQGFRSGALERMGFGEAELARLRPGIVAVSINCYGHGGPWCERPGWEQLAQTATGIALEQGGASGPALLPAAATDYTTGYLAAFGALVALIRRAREGGSWAVRASLCQTGMWIERGNRVDAGAARGLDLAALAPHFALSETPHGRLRALGPVLEMSGTPARWEQPSVPLGTHAPEWLTPERGGARLA
jgi:crotonobetainyl-CoA:carnitine CoA-transferase CaiB-like acyl-CoA transferase